MRHTICLLCNRKRCETVCGDNTCYCSDAPDSKRSPARRIIIPGLQYIRQDGAILTEQPCGRVVLERQTNRRTTTAA